MFESINLIKMTTGKSQERIFFYTSKYMQTFILFLGVTYSVVEEYVNTRLYPVQSSFGEISENCDFGQKCVCLFFTKNFENIFSAQIVLHSFCN